MKTTMILLVTAMISMANIANAQNNSENNVVMKVIETTFNADSSVLFETWSGEYSLGKENLTFGSAEIQKITIKTRTVLQKNSILMDNEWVPLTNGNTLLGVEYSQTKGLIMLHEKNGITVLPRTNKFFIYTKKK